MELGYSTRVCWPLKWCHMVTLYSSTSVRPYFKDIMKENTLSYFWFSTAEEIDIFDVIFYFFRLIEWLNSRKGLLYSVHKIVLLYFIFIFRYSWFCGVSSVPYSTSSFFYTDTFILTFIYQCLGLIIVNRYCSNIYG